MPFDITLTQDEVARLITDLEPPFRLMATLLYRSVLRLRDLTCEGEQNFTHIQTSTLFPVNFRRPLFSGVLDVVAPQRFFVAQV